jgi:hypothetical protein
LRGVRRRPDIEGKFALFGNTINAENPLGNGAGPQTNANFRESLAMQNAVGARGGGREAVAPLPVAPRDSVSV